MTTAKTPNPQSHFRLPDPPPREPDEMTAFDHVYKQGNNRYLAIHLGNQDTTLVVADRWIIAHPDADRSRARRPDLLIAFNVDPAAYHASNGYIVSEQGKPPDFVLEVASESTGATDTGAKRQDYAALGISEYWRFDETGQHHGVRLAGDQLVGDRAAHMAHFTAALYRTTGCVIDVACCLAQIRTLCAVKITFQASNLSFCI